MKTYLQIFLPQKYGTKDYCKHKNSFKVIEKYDFTVTTATAKLCYECFW